jgi:hypothetical protein
MNCCGVQDDDQRHHRNNSFVAGSSAGDGMAARVVSTDPGPAVNKFSSRTDASRWALGVVGRESCDGLTLIRSVAAAPRGSACQPGFWALRFNSGYPATGELRNGRQGQY